MTHGAPDDDQLVAKKLAGNSYQRSDDLRRTLQIFADDREYRSEVTPQARETMGEERRRWRSAQGVASVESTLGPTTPASGSERGMSEIGAQRPHSAVLAGVPRRHPEALIAVAKDARSE